MLQKQVQTLPVDHSNSYKMGNKIILLHICIWNTSFNKLKSNSIYIGQLVQCLAAPLILRMRVYIGDVAIT